MNDRYVFFPATEDSPAHIESVESDNEVVSIAVRMFFEEDRDNVFYIIKDDTMKKCRLNYTFID